MNDQLQDWEEVLKERINTIKHDILSDDIDSMNELLDHSDSENKKKRFFIYWDYRAIVLFGLLISFITILSFVLGSYYSNPESIHFSNRPPEISDDAKNISENESNELIQTSHRGKKHVTSTDKKPTNENVSNKDNSSVHRVEVNGHELHNYRTSIGLKSNTTPKTLLEDNTHENNYTIVTYQDFQEPMFISGQFFEFKPPPALSHSILEIPDEGYITIQKPITSFVHLSNKSITNRGKIKSGLQAGYAHPIFTTEGFQSPNVPLLGIWAQKKLNERISAGLELNYKYVNSYGKLATFEIQDSDNSDASVVSRSFSIDGVHWLEIPVYIKYNAIHKFSILGGIRTGLLLNQSIIPMDKVVQVGTNSGIVSNPNALFYFAPDEVKSNYWNLSALAGVSYRISSHFNLSLRANFSFSNAISTSSINQIKNAFKEDFMRTIPNSISVYNNKTFNTDAQLLIKYSF